VVYVATLAVGSSPLRPEPNLLQMKSRHYTVRLCCFERHAKIRHLPIGSYGVERHAGVDRPAALLDHFEQLAACLLRSSSIDQTLASLKLTKQNRGWKLISCKVDEDVFILFEIS
jgi:hypothetical protein